MTVSEIERLAVLETKITGIASDVSEIKDALSGLDNKYAAKWVQSAVSFVVGIIVSAVLIAFMAFVLAKPTGDRTNQTNPSSSSTTTTNTPTGSTSETTNSGSTGSSTPDN